MYKSFLRWFFGLTILTGFWPVLRIASVSLFDLLAPAAIFLALLYHPKERGIGLASFRLAIAGIFFLIFGGMISIPSSSNDFDHITKVIKLVVALSGMIGLAYLAVNRKILSIQESLKLLALSASISSLICLLQGQFGILASIVPDTSLGIEEWTRFTGFAEHPIEMGITSAFGAAISLGLAIETRKWLSFGLLVAINVVALKFSASLTSVFALFASCAIVCWMTKSYKIMIAAGVAGTVGGIVAFSAGLLGPLTIRIENLIETQGNYGTLQTREQQVGRALNMIEPSTLFVGNGYSTADLPFNMEIHNGLVASVFHFGLLGLMSQFLLILFFALPTTRRDISQSYKAILMACLLIFLCAYLTGPPFSRRSLWVPMLILGAYLRDGQAKKVPIGKK